MSAVATAPQDAGTGTRKLDGRVALVTGGIRGIGAAIVKSHAGEGASAAAGYSSDRSRDKAEAFLEELRGMGANASIHQGNIAQCEDCQRTVQEVIEQHGRLDILVNNAGITNDRPVLKMSADRKSTRLNSSHANISYAVFC